MTKSVSLMRRFRRLLAGTAEAPTPAGEDAVTELDLLAYADRRLEDDPARRALVERHLAAQPEQAERIAAFQAQNEALTRAGAAWVEAPVPPRLLAALAQEKPAPRRLATQAAAMAALVAVSASAGWHAGIERSTGDGSTGSFAASALSDYRQQPDTTAQAPATAQAHRAAGGAGAGDFAIGTLPANDLGSQVLSRQGLAPVTWLRRRIAVEVEAPDLGAEGFSLVESRRVELKGTPAVRLLYQRAGERVSLYLRPRWEEGAGPVARTESDGLTVLHWLDGPLAIALVTDGTDGEATAALARRVHRTLARPQLVEPSAEPDRSQDARLGAPSGPELLSLGETLSSQPQPAAQTEPAL
ncbi:MAG: hypothetical protein WD100_02425 [Tistlia sp.]|uniref:anti-sigma factor n=1 Tax=Tistlia sp. TaxID=3057121 RepID=UPI0034A58778